eukprot:c23092_g1_i1 orf=273-1727(+)
MSVLERVGNAHQSQIPLLCTDAHPDFFTHSRLLHQDTRQGNFVAKAHVSTAHDLIDNVTCPTRVVFDTPKLNDTVLSMVTGPTRVFDTPKLDGTILSTSLSDPCSAWTFDAQKLSASEGAITNTPISYNNVCLYDSACLRRLCEFENPDSVLQTLCILDKQGFFIAHDILFHFLQKCIDELDLLRGRKVFSLIVSNGLDFIASFGDHLVNLFVSSGSLREALPIFHKIAQPNVRSWHTLISGCVLLGEANLAFELFDQMQQAGMQPNDFIFTSILKACGNTGALGYGRIIHIQIIRQGLASNVFIGSTLIDMYAKCECLDQARQVFDELQVRNVVSWNAMIGGYVKHGHGVHALQLFNEMQLEGIKPDRVTFLYMLKACGVLGVTEQGMLVHSHAVGGGLVSNVPVGTALIDMYAKCGNLNHAHEVLNRLQNRDVGSWSALITAFAQHGHGKKALELATQMSREGIKLNHITLLSILSACSHAG